MDHYCAPQWVDFSSSPQIPCDNYFDKYHHIHESNICPEVPKNSVKIKKKVSEIIQTPKKYIQLKVKDKDIMKSTANLNENYETEIDNLKSTPIKVISALKNNGSKHEVVKEMTYDNVLLEAVKNVQLCENLHEVKQEIELLSTENMFKKPMLMNNKTSKPVRICEMDNSNISIPSSEETQNIIKLSSSTENIFKTPILMKNKTSKPVRIHELCEVDKSNISISSSEGTQDIIKGKEETKSVSSNVDMIKPENNASMIITENVTKTLQIKDHSKSNIKNSAVKNDHIKLKVDNKNIKLKLSTVKQQTSMVRGGESTKSNTLNRSVTTCKQKEKVESKSKIVRKDSLKSTQLQQDSVYSSVSLKKTVQKNIGVLNRDSRVEGKQTPSSCFSAVVKQEKTSCQKSTRSKRSVFTIVGYNTGSEIIMKKEKILFFDIPVHTKQKKVTCPVPFSFENRDKIKKQLKLDQSESKSIKSKSVTDIKLVSDINKTQKDKKTKFGNFAKKGITNFCTRKGMNEKNKGIKRPENRETINTFNMQSVTMRKPMRTISALKNNNHQKDKEKTGKEKSKDIKNTKDANYGRNPLKPISCKDIHINKNSNIQMKETLNKNKCIQKENRQPNINVAALNNNNLNQKKGMELKSTVMKKNVAESKKKHEFEERMRQKKIMYEEKLRKEREEKLAKEKLEIAKLRKQAEIKARPMPVYKPLIHVKSTKPLTKPQSPAWSSHRVSKIKETS